MADAATILDRFRLNGKTALVTGASSGLGRAIAEGLAEAGADVAVTSRRRERLDGIVEYVTGRGRRCVPIVCDMEDADQARALIGLAEEQLGALDVLVNNAGTTFRAPAEEFPESEWDRVVQVNLKSVWVACQEAGRRMLARKSGKIINIASMLSFTGGITVPAYAATKGAVALLTKALSNEWAKDNVQVNAIAPGYFVTEMTQDLHDDPVRNPEISSRIPAGRWGDPSELKGAAVYLASPASDYVSGHILVVDGGWLAR